MHIEHLSHWVVILTVKCMSIDTDMEASQLLSLLLQVSHNEYYDLGMIDACASFIEEGRVQLLPFQV